MSIATTILERDDEAELALVLMRAAQKVAAAEGLKEPLLTLPREAFVIHAGDLNESLVDATQQVGWQAFLFDGVAPRALIEASRKSGGRITFTCSTTGEWPAALNEAVLYAEDRGLLREDGEFAFVTVPQIGLTILWIDESDVMVPVVSRAGVERLQTYTAPEMRDAAAAAAERYSDAPFANET